MRFALLAAFVIPAVYATIPLNSPEEVRAVVNGYIGNVLAAGNKVKLMQAGAALESPVAAVASSSVIIPTRDENGNYVYDVPANLFSSTSPPPAPTSVTPALKRLQEKVEISNDDFYYSQTDSFAVPDVSTIDPNSPYVRPYPNVPKKKKSAKGAKRNQRNH